MHYYIIYSKRAGLQKQTGAFGASGEARTRNGGVGGLCFIQLDYGCVWFHFPFR